jgi:hypothetical protein
MIDGIEPEAVWKIVGLVIAAIASAFFGRSIMIRRMSKDGVVIAQDRGQVNMIDVLRSERDQHAARADEANRKYSEAMLEMGGLRNEVAHLTRRLAEQSRDMLAQAVQIEALQKKVEALNDHIHSLVGLKDVGINIETPKGGT